MPIIERQKRTNVQEYELGRQEGNGGYSLIMTDRREIHVDNLVESLTSRFFLIPSVPVDQTSS
jgi:hypothetical protein